MRNWIEAILGVSVSPCFAHYVGCSWRIVVQSSVLRFVYNNLQIVPICMLHKTYTQVIGDGMVNHKSIMQ